MLACAQFRRDIPRPKRGARRRPANTPSRMDTARASSSASARAAPEFIHLHTALVLLIFVAHERQRNTCSDTGHAVAVVVHSTR